MQWDSAGRVSESVSGMPNAAQDRLSNLLDLARRIGEMSVEERDALEALMRLTAPPPVLDP